MQRIPRSLKQLTRRGSAAPFLIVSMSVFLSAFALAVNKGWLWSVREELKSTADAAALSAMQSYIDDDLLRGDTNRLPELMTRACQSACQFCQCNSVRGRPMQLMDNPSNDPAGDIVFGTVTTPRSGDFKATPSRMYPDQHQGSMNAVIVQARLTRSRGNAPGLIFGPVTGHSAVDAQAMSGVVFDRGVRGFRPLYGNLPLAPIALLSDDTGTNVRSWENQVAHKMGPDVHRFEKSLKAFVSDSRGDQIHEFTAAYATKEEHLFATNCAVLHLGTSDLIRIGSQLKNGLTKEDLNFLGGKLVLHETDGLDVGAQQISGEVDQPGIQTIASALIELKNQAAVRVWPLYSTIVVGQAHLTGFVAARVVSVVPPSSETPLIFELQATVISRPDAITDTDLRGKQATMDGNLYVGKIRRIE